MANPLGALGSVPIMQVIQDTLQRSATIRNQQILGDERQQLMQIRAQEMEQQRKFLEAFAHPPVPPNSDSMSSSGDFGGAFDLNDPLGISYKSTLADIKTNQDLANRYRGGGTMQSLQMAEKYDALVRQGQGDLRAISEKIYDKQQQSYKDAAQVLQGVDGKNQAQLESAISYMGRNFPKATVQKALSGIPFDPETGLPIAGIQAERAITNLQNQFTTAHEKATQTQAAISAENTADAREQAHKDRVSAQQHADARAAASRLQRQKQIDLMQEQKGDKEVRQIEKTAQDDLNKMEVVKNFDKSANAFLAAKNVSRQLEAGGLRDTAAPDIQSMVRGYDQMINNFRSFMGGKWQAQQDEQMQGTLQKVRAYFTTIGQGKKPDVALVRDIAAEIARVHQDTNAVVMKRTLEARAKVATQGGDPNQVLSPAQASEVIRTNRGVIQTDPKTGRQYMAFRIGKDKPDKEDVVPIYDKPVFRRKGVVYMDQLDEEEE